jgi:hypothetical protein
MDLFIPDLCEVLKCRVKSLTDKKTQGDPTQIVAGIADVRSVLNEMESKAEQLAHEKERLRAEADGE